MGENIAVALIALGVLGLCQPYVMAWYTCSFTILLMGMLAYIVIGHIGG